VPEATVDVDDLAVSREDDVGGAGEGADVEAVAEAEAVEVQVPCRLASPASWASLILALRRSASNWLSFIESMSSS